MPKTTQAHEDAVRGRIIEAALRVFAERGYHAATMQDVVRESGLSVGAIYTYFRSKDELFLATCDLSAGIGMGELGDRVVRGRTLPEKLAIAIGFFLDAIDEPGGGAGMASILVQQWARAEQDPEVRAMLARRRDQIVAAAQLLVREGIASRDLPAWMDPVALGEAYSLLLDGLLLWRIEQGSAYRRIEAERRAHTLLLALLAAAAAPEAPELPAIPARPWSVRTGAVRVS